MDPQAATRQDRPPNPGAAPTATPQEPAGEQMLAVAEVVAARRILLKQAEKFEPGSDKHKALLEAAEKITRGFGDDEDEGEELAPALKRLYLSDLLGPAKTPPTAPPPMANPMGAQPPGGQPPGAMPPG